MGRDSPGRPRKAVAAVFNAPKIVRYDGRGLVRSEPARAMADEYFSLVCDDVPHDLLLTDPGVRVMDVVQVVRRLTGLSLWRSQGLATQVPAVVLACVPEEDAAAAVSALRDAGARVETRERPEPDS